MRQHFFGRGFNIWSNEIQRKKNLMDTSDTFEIDEKKEPEGR